MTPSTKRRPPLCLEHVAWLLLKADPLIHRFLKALYRKSSELESLGHTARGFFEMIRNRDAVAWHNGLRLRRTPHWHRSRAGLNEIAVPSTLLHGATGWWKDTYTG